MLGQLIELAKSHGDNYVDTESNNNINKQVEAIVSCSIESVHLSTLYRGYQRLKVLFLIMNRLARNIHTSNY